MSRNSLTFQPPVLNCSQSFLLFTHTISLVLKTYCFLQREILYISLKMKMYSQRPLKLRYHLTKLLVLHRCILGVLVFEDLLIIINHNLSRKWSPRFKIAHVWRYGWEQTRCLGAHSLRDQALGWNIWTNFILSNLIFNKMSFLFFRMEEPTVIIRPHLFDLGGNGHLWGGVNDLSRQDL